jgi:hypothetical protein
MKSLGLITLLLFLIINVSCSSVDDEARALMKRIEKEDKIQDVGIFIIKNGKEKSIIECYAEKKLASEAACRKVVEFAITQLDSQTKKFIQQMIDEGKWQDIINYVKQNGVEAAADSCTKKKLTYKAICYNVAVIASKETPSSSSS